MCLAAVGKLASTSVNAFGHVKTAEQTGLRRNTVIGTVAIDGWAVAFGVARRGLGKLRPRTVPSSLYQE